MMCAVPGDIRAGGVGCAEVDARHARVREGLGTSVGICICVLIEAICC